MSKAAPRAVEVEHAALALGLGPRQIGLRGRHGLRVRPGQQPGGFSPRLFRALAGDHVQTDAVVERAFVRVRRVRRSTRSSPRPRRASHPTSGRCRHGGRRPFPPPATSRRRIPAATDPGDGRALRSPPAHGFRRSSPARRTPQPAHDGQELVATLVAGLLGGRRTHAVHWPHRRLQR